jgi:pantoate kinase
MSFKNFVYEGVRAVQLENVGSGTITVEPGPRADLVEGSVNVAEGGHLDDVVVRQEADQLRIIVSQQGFQSAPAHVRLGVPAGLGYSIRAGAATIAITADVDRAKIVSGSGDVSIDSVSELDCSTGSGAISVIRLLNRGARLHTGSGDITVAEARSPLSAKSGSGDIIVRSLRQADLAASSGSGDIAVPSTTGSVDLRSASGSLTVGVADELPVWLDLNSVSGAIRIALDASSEPAPGEPYLSVRASTASGEIAVYRA